MTSFEWPELEAEHGVSLVQLIAPPETWNTFLVLLTQAEKWALMRKEFHVGTIFEYVLDLHFMTADFH